MPAIIHCCGYESIKLPLKFPFKTVLPLVLLQLSDKKLFIEPFMILKFCILPSKSLIFLLRSFITYSAKQLALKPSLEERLGFGLINGEEEQWIEGRMGGMVQTISYVLLARTNSSFLY